MIQDLFIIYELQPPELKAITNKYNTLLDECASYELITKFHNEVYEIGYIFDSGLDAVPFGLRPIGVKLNELVGW